MRVRLTPFAVEDIEKARDYYTGLGEHLGAGFLDDLELTVERLVMFPNGAPPVEGFDGLRRARLRRFPYGIFYRHIEPGELLLVRVLHSQRDHPRALDDPSP